MKRIYLLRHGEAVDDVEDCYGGVADFPLSEGGLETAESMAKRLSDSGIEILFSSPYKRAAQTAEAIAGPLNCQVKIVANLRERNSYGVLSGVNKDRAKEIFGHILSGIDGKPGDYYGTESVLGDESISEFDSRVREAFEACTQAEDNAETIGIVTHGNVTRSLYRNILGITGKVELGLLAVTVIIEKEEGLEIESMDGVSVE